MMKRCQLSRQTQRGSALILIPAWILIMMMLGGIAVDTAAIHMAQRRGNRQLAAIVADASQILNTSHLLETGDMQVHPEGARRVITELIEQNEFPGIVHSNPHIEIDPATGIISVNMELEVPHIFLQAAPTAPEVAVIALQASAVFVP